MRLFDCPWRLGVALRQDGLDACLLKRRRGRPKVMRRVSLDHAGPMLTPVDAAALTALFGTLRKKLPKAWMRADLRVQVAVPEALVTEDLLAFDSFPESAKEGDMLVRHRFARELRLPPEALCVTWERVDDGLVRARSLPRDLVDALEEATGRARLRMTRLEGMLGYVPGDATAGSLLWSDGRDWLFRTGAEGVPGGFCDAGPLAEDTAARVLRLHRSFALKHGLAAHPLRLDVPEGLEREMRDRAGELTFLTEALDARLPDGAARVAAWG